MDESLMIEMLMEFGMSRQESIIYLCLSRNQEVSGYEAAKQTGISRSNVYSALAGLVEKGAAYLIEGGTNKYVAVPVQEFCENKMRRFQKLKENLAQNIRVAAENTEGYITVSGYQHIEDKVYTMLEQVQERLYLAAPSGFIESYQEVLQKLLDKKLKVVLITDQLLDLTGAIEYLTVKKEKQIRLIVDSSYVLTGDITGNASDTCLYSGQRNFVNVFKEALRNEIKLIELTGGEKQHD